LGDLNCKSFAVEHRYIDGDYMDDHCLFYARCHRPYPNYCRRIHFFAGTCSRARLVKVIEEIQQHPASPLRTDPTPRWENLQKDYLGFLVVRPNRCAFVGRTVLTGLPGAERKYTCTRRYDVNLAGIDLYVDGLAFQQQDRAIAACATTALWVALQKAAYDVCFRVPTSSEITVNATRFSLEGGRSIPSSGLSMGQMCEAVRASGLEPGLFEVSAEPRLLRRMAHAYLQSGFPVIAGLYFYDSEEYAEAAKQASPVAPALDPNSGHAIALVGFRLDPQRNRTVPVKFATAAGGEQTTSVMMTGEAVSEFYAHDDRLGPYARVKCLEAPWGTSDVSIEWPAPRQAEVARVVYLLVPVYPKIRLGHQDMEGKALGLLQGLAKIGLPALPALELDFAIWRSRMYRNVLISSQPAMPPRLLYDMLTADSVARYIGVCSVRLDGAPFLDVLFDTTESTLGASVIGVVCRNEQLRTIASQLSRLLGISFYG